MPSPICASKVPNASSTSKSKSKSKSKKEPHVYPAPFVVRPTPPHTHTSTLILLHGRGSNGEKFGTEFLASQTASAKTLPDVFPSMKFVFPTAKKRRARWYNRALINQWFDNVPIDEQENGMSREEKEWQLGGLAETATFLRGLLVEECEAVRRGNVFLGGLSQGCAMAVSVLLGGVGVDDVVEGGLGGFVGMSAWLPFGHEIEEVLGMDEEKKVEGTEEKEADVDGDDPFATSDNEDEDSGFSFEAEISELSPALQVINFVRDNMGLSPFEITSEPAFLRTPIFLGHGKSDGKVKIKYGTEMRDVLEKMGMDIRWREYDVGHWWKVPEEIDDIVEFLERCSGRAVGEIVGGRGT